MTKKEQTEIIEIDIVGNNYVVREIPTKKGDVTLTLSPDQLSSLLGSLLGMVATMCGTGIAAQRRLGEILDTARDMAIHSADICRREAAGEN